MLGKVEKVATEGYCIDLVTIIDLEPKDVSKDTVFKPRDFQTAERLISNNFNFWHSINEEND